MMLLVVVVLVLQSASCWVSLGVHGVTVPACFSYWSCSRSSSTLLPAACTLTW
jgi:hypothetical protein